MQQLLRNSRLSGVFRILVLLALVFPANAYLMPSTASAHHNEFNASANCYEWDAQAAYIGGGSRRAIVLTDVVINGVPYDQSWSAQAFQTYADYAGPKDGLPTSGTRFVWDGTSNGFEIFDRSGNTLNTNWTGTIKLYYLDNNKWKLDSTQNITAPTAPSNCQCYTDQLVQKMSDFNLITLGDLYTNSDIEGKTRVGDDIESSDSANFAIKLDASTPANAPTLVVIDDIKSGNALHLKYGSLYQGPNGSVQNSRVIDYQQAGGARFVDNTLNNSTMVTILQESSAQLAAMVPNNTVQLPTSQPAAVKFTVQNVNSSGQAVFDVDGDVICLKIQKCNRSRLNQVVRPLLLSMCPGLTSNGTLAIWWERS
jgi:hypothetical protein